MDSCRFMASGGAMIYAILNDKKHGPFKSFAELKLLMFYEGARHDELKVYDIKTDKVLATFKKEWLRMDEGPAWWQVGQNGRFIR